VDRPNIAALPNHLHEDFTCQIRKSVIFILWISEAHYPLTEKLTRC
jgi:hypothetical protein